MIPVVGVVASEHTDIVSEGTVISDGGGELGVNAKLVHAEKTEEGGGVGGPSQASHDGLSCMPATVLNHIAASRIHLKKQRCGWHGA